LVVPDGDEPVFRLFSEGEPESEAAGLLEYYADLIRSHQHEER